MEDINDKKGQAELRDKVLDARLCTGCGACVGLCPYQATYHDQTIQLHQCDLPTGRCYAFCPRTPSDLETLRNSFFDASETTTEIGPVKGFYICRAADEANRSRAQHGGTVTAMVSLALKEGFIDSAVVSEGREGFLLQAVTLTDPTDVSNRGKSKFIVSHTVAEFHRIAGGSSRKIGVVATPCQAFALAKMRLKPIETKDNNIDKLQLVIGLFCGWTLDWRKFSDLLKKKTQLDAVTGMDIPPGKKAVEIYTRSGTIALSMEEIDPCIREACRYCLDTTAEFSDISVGSARLPEPWEETRRWNQVIARTTRGQELLDLARERGILAFREVPPGNLDELKRAALEKKKAAIRHLIEKSGSADNLIYLDHRDPLISSLLC
jgi:coenzyme F420 hydrogenase subunit beta